MELMDQSRKLAEDQAYEAQRKTRSIEKESLKSPHLGRGRGSERRNRSPLRDGRSGRNSRSPTSIEYTKIITTNTPDPRTGLPYISGERQHQKYDRSGTFLRCRRDYQQYSYPCPYSQFFLFFFMEPSFFFF